MRNRHNKISGQFAAQLIEMLRSPAYRVLSLSALRVLARLQIELAQHGGRDNGKLPCTYNQLEEYGVHRHGIGAAIRELVALGFIEITEKGRPSAGEFRSPSRYRLTFRPTESSAPTDDWREITTFEEAIKLGKGARAERSQVRARYVRKN